MAYRDLTQRFNERRQNLKKRNLRFQLRHLKENPPYLVLFQSKQVHGRVSLHLVNEEICQREPDYVSFLLVSNCFTTPANEISRDGESPAPGSHRV